MSTDQATSNKATLTRFQGALSSGDWGLISKTIDEVVEPEGSGRSVIAHGIPPPNRRRRSHAH